VERPRCSPDTDPTASTGADVAAHRRGLVWIIDATATAVQTNADDETTAERYRAAFRGQRKLTRIIGLSAGEKVERDRFAGIDVRSILDGGFRWALVRRPVWTIDGVTALAWNHESRTTGPDLDDPIGVFQLLSRVPFGAAGTRRSDLRTTRISSTRLSTAPKRKSPRRRRWPHISR
jgi:hypothetical protein